MLNDWFEICTKNAWTWLLMNCISCNTIDSSTLLLDTISLGSCINKIISTCLDIWEGVFFEKEFLVGRRSDFSSWSSTKAALPVRVFGAKSLLHSYKLEQGLPPNIEMDRIYVTLCYHGPLNRVKYARYDGELYEKCASIQYLYDSKKCIYCYMLNLISIHVP